MRRLARTELDLLSPGLGESNLNKKIRGSMKPNVLPINSREDAETLLRSVKLTRRTILSKVAELYDPCGFWEPIKLQMRLAMLPLKGCWKGTGNCIANGTRYS